MEAFPGLLLYLFGQITHRFNKISQVTKSTTLNIQITSKTTDKDFSD